MNENKDEQNSVLFRGYEGVLKNIGMNNIVRFLKTQHYR